MKVRSKHVHQCDKSHFSLFLWGGGGVSRPPDLFPIDGTGLVCDIPSVGDVLLRATDFSFRRDDTQSRVRLSRFNGCMASLGRRHFTPQNTRSLDARGLSFRQRPTTFVGEHQVSVDPSLGGREWWCVVFD